jgi:type IV secretory pathway TraG/TraD family ATPase VirD4
VSETGERDDDVWLETSRILVANVLRVLNAEGKTTLPDLLNALQAKTKEEMKVWLAGTSSARTFEDDADRATGSVLFMLAKASNLLQFLWREPGENGSFAFRDFINGLDKHQGPKPWIFVPRKEDYFEAMKPLLACWLECAASATLGLEPSSSRRLWFFLDELADLPRVDNLTRLLPEGRKFGASVVLTFQAIGQMHRRYGRDSAEALLGCCNTKLYLQLIDRDTRKWASDNIGDVEVEIRSGSDSFEYGPNSGRTSLGSVRHVRAAVIESDMRLEPHQGFLQLPDALPVAKIRLTRAHIDARGNPRQRSFVPVDVSRSLWSKLPAKGAAAEATIKGDGPV